MSHEHLDKLEALARALTHGEASIRMYVDGRGSQNWPSYFAALDPQTVLELIAEARRLTAEVERLRGQVEIERDRADDSQTLAEEREAEVQRLREANEALAAYVLFSKERDDDGDGNAPGHGHLRPGIWDDDNGPKAGKACHRCKLWNAAVRAALSSTQPAPVNGDSNAPE